MRVHAADLPLLCGFGISQPDQVRELRAAGADGVIVGSAAISALEAGGTAGLATFVRSLAQAL